MTLYGGYYEHKNDLVEGFTQKYAVHDLFYYERHDRIEDAIVREKQLKMWKREWKLRIIENFNPEWNDLYRNII